jgi:8-oxo-dGTP diphosphatase
MTDAARHEPQGPVLCADIVVERQLADGRRALLLVERKWPPYGWALPGGHVDAGESVEQAAVRELLEETGLHGELQYQLHTYSDPKRDPRKPTASVVFVALAQGEPHAADDAKDVKFWPIDTLPPLCFDHDQIVADYLSGRYVPAHARQ